MSKREAEMLTDWGRFWWVHVWSGTDAATRNQVRDNLIQHVNGQLNAIGFRLGRGWQDYDPVIRAKNRKPSSYVQIAEWAGRQPNNGRDLARLFHDWATRDMIVLHDLPLHLMDLAIITHLAESARGYHTSNEVQLYPLMADIASGTKGWGDIKDYSPSLTFKEDMADWYQD